MEKEKNEYQKAFDASMDPKGRLEFWGEMAKNVDWVKFPKDILNEDHPPFYRWFKDGVLNLCHNCVDRHLEKLGDNVALVYDSTICNKKVKYTFKELHDHVSRLGGVMQDKFGVEKGDRVIIYMPMIPEAIFAMLACARIGAIHSVVFGGFAAKELGSRITDAKPKLIISASCGIEPHKKIDYKVILDGAIKLSGVSGVKTLVK
jgi:propionyl-CoA synthetase